MKWKGRRGSSNIEDRRRTSGSRRGAGAIGGAGGVGVLVIVALGYFLGVDLTPLLDQDGPGQSTGQTRELSQDDLDSGQFVSVVLADTEEVWTRVFRDDLSQTYSAPVLVLFSGATQSACGGASAATGPFYCPPERKVYLDTEFFDTMERQLGAGGDFAAAYVVAHEVGHHVQNELGILDEANRRRARVSETESNEISVRIELQADCFSGVWAHDAQATFGSLEPGDIAEAMNAAERIGDDTLQRGAGQRVQPDSFTHGTSDQRQRWFSRGYESGSIAQCDTFGAQSL